MSKPARTLPPNDAEYILEVLKAEPHITKNGHTVIRAFLEEGYVVYLGPIDYPRACVQAGVAPRSVLNNFKMSDIWHLMSLCPQDPKFLVGKHLRVKVKHGLLPDKGMVFTLRFMYLVHQGVDFS